MLEMATSKNAVVVISTVLLAEAKLDFRLDGSCLHLVDNYSLTELCCQDNTKGRDDGPDRTSAAVYVPEILTGPSRTHPKKVTCISIYRGLSHLSNNSFHTRIQVTLVFVLLCPMMVLRIVSLRL